MLDCQFVARLQEICISKDNQRRIHGIDIMPEAVVQYTLQHSWLPFTGPGYHSAYKAGME
jgi:hypothetical protein